MNHCNGSLDDTTTDLTWRAPVPPPQQRHACLTTTTPGCSSGGTATAATNKLAHYDAHLQPYVSQLLVSCHVLRLGMETTFAAACLLHRYCGCCADNGCRLSKEGQALFNEDDDDDNEKVRWILVSIILIAGKAEEEHRRLRDFINLAHMVSWQQQPQMPSRQNSSDHHSTNHHCANDNDNEKDGNRKSGTNALNENQNEAKPVSTEVSTTTVLVWNGQPPKLDDKYWQDKERLVKAEQHVLRQLGFDVIVSHPHRLVVLLVQQDGGGEEEEGGIFVLVPQDDDHQNHPVAGTAETFRKEDLPTSQWRYFKKTLVEQTWVLLNSCVFSIAALQLPTLVLAVTALDLTLQSTMEHLPAHVKVRNEWWKSLGLSNQVKQQATRIIQAVKTPST